MPTPSFAQRGTKNDVVRKNLRDEQDLEVKNLSKQFSSPNEMSKKASHFDLFSL